MSPHSLCTRDSQFGIHFVQFCLFLVKTKICYRFLLCAWCLFEYRYKDMQYLALQSVAKIHHFYDFKFSGNTGISIFITIKPRYQNDDRML